MTDSFGTNLFRSSESGMFGRALRHERGARIPVIVVTGFLGAGKTTLVKNFIESEAGYGTALVVNEFGEAGIDDVLLRSSKDETVLIGNGCLCCNVRSDLQIALGKLMTDRERGLVPHFQRVVIETSGLADPGPILRTFATDRALGGAYYVEAVITAIDAVHGVATLDDFAEARQQAMLADTFIITKTDLANGKSDALTTKLRALNPRARIVTSDKGRVAGDVFAGNGMLASQDANLFTAEAVHADRILSFTLTWDRPLQWPVVARTMETLLALRGSDLLRAKGILDVEGCSGPVVVQFVQHLAHPPAELQRWPGDDRRSRLVFITRNIAERDVRALFEAVERLATPAAET